MREDWVSGRLGDFFEVVTGGTPPKSNPEMFGDYMPLVKPPELNGREVSRATDNLSLAGAGSSRVLPTGSVLVSCIGNLGKLGLSAVPLATNQQINAIKPNEKVALPKYVFYWAMSPFFSESLRRKASGTTVPIVNKSKFSSIKISLPPLPEQERIVAILDEAFTGIATAVANTERNLANARELFESYLNVVFGKRGEGWVNKKLGEVCDGKITDGTHQTPKYYDEGIIFLSSRNVKSGEIDWQNIKYVDRSQHEAMQKRVSPRPGDILLAKNGTTGVAAIVDRDVSFDIYVSLALLRPSTHMDSRYLWHFINSPIAKKQFNKRLKGVGVPNLHLKEIREVELSFPLAKSEQVRVVERLDEVLEEKQKLASIYQQKLNALAELRQSLLQKAFAGELTAVPQDDIEAALA